MGKEGATSLFYFGVHQPAEWTLDLPEGNRYQAEVIDTWEMTIAPIEGAFTSRQSQAPCRLGL